LQSIAKAEEENEEPLLKVQGKTEEEHDKDQQHFLMALAVNDPVLKLKVEQDPKVALEFAKQKYVKSVADDKLTKEDNEFLLNYIMEGGWIDKNNNFEADSDENNVTLKSETKESNIVYNDSDDEKHLEENDFFEAAYNFRFEQEGGNQVVTYPRNIDTVRTKNTKRKEERERHKKNKEEQELKKEKKSNA